MTGPTTSPQEVNLPPQQTEVGDSFSAQTPGISRGRTISWKPSFRQKEVGKKIFKLALLILAGVAIVTTIVFAFKASLLLGLGVSACYGFLGWIAKNKIVGEVKYSYSSLKRQFS